MGKCMCWIESGSDDALAKRVQEAAFRAQWQRISRLPAPASPRGEWDAVLKAWATDKAFGYLECPGTQTGIRAPITKGQLLRFIEEVVDTRIGPKPPTLAELRRFIDEHFRDNVNYWLVAGNPMD